MANDPYEQYDRDMDRDAEADAEWFLKIIGFVCLVLLGIACGIIYWVKS